MANLTPEQFEDASARLLSLGAHIEELFVHQYDRIGFHNDEVGNHYRVQEGHLGSLMLDESLTDEKRKEAAEALLRLTDTYKDGFLHSLQSLDDDIRRELLSFEEALNAISDDIADPHVLERLRRWLSLSAELFVARRNATKSVFLRVETDRTVPSMVIKHNGRTDTTLTKEETQIFAETLAHATVLLKQSYEDNERIQTERLQLAKIFSQTVEPAQANEKPGVGAVVRPPPKTHPLESRAWFRLVKVVYVALWVLAIGVCIVLGISGEPSLLVGSAVVFAAALIVLKKGFYYVTLGRTTAAEPPGTGFIDLDELRDDFAGLQASDPKTYQTMVAPMFESWRAQYGRRVPIHAFDHFRKRIDAELESIREKKQKIIDDAVKKGTTLEVARLRESLEKAKAEHKGSEREAFVRHVDSWIMRLEAQYGTAIPIDEASRLLDELEAGIRVDQRRQE